jgi:hypothetical protein
MWGITFMTSDDFNHLLMTIRTLGKKAKEAGLTNFMISDLCRMAIGETLPADKRL